MSVQPPIPQPPVINQTNTTTSTPPTPPADLTNQLLNIFREPWFILSMIIVAVAVLLITLLILVISKSKGTPYMKTLKKKGDAYSIVIDLNTRTIYMTPMRRLSPYRYMYIKDGIKYIFTPINNKPFVLEGSSTPCFIAVSGGPSLAFELDPSITLSLSLASNKEDLLNAEKMKDVIDKLTAEVLSGTTSYTSEIPSLPGISFEVNIPKYLTTLYMTIANKHKALLSALTDSWTAIEEMAKTLKSEKYAGLPRLGTFLLYLGGFIVILIISIWLAMYLGVIR